MADLALIRDALRDPTIAAYPDFTAAISDACDEIDRLRAGIKRLSDEEELCAETTGDDPFSLVYLAAKLAHAEAEIERLRATLDESQDMHLSAVRLCCIRRDTIRKMQERYENWTPIDVQPSEHSNPHALLEFRCISEADEDAENPEYFATRIWDERPDDAVEWCAINSPCFIALRHQSQDATDTSGAIPPTADAMDKERG